MSIFTVVVVHFKPAVDSQQRVEQTSDRVREQ
jgi:hypothetical protein